MCCQPVVLDETLLFIAKDNASCRRELGGGASPYINGLNILRLSLFFGFGGQTNIR